MICNKVHELLKDANMAFTEAKQVLKASLLLQNSKSEICFYEDIGVFRLLFQMEGESVLQSFAADYLGKMIEYDRIHRSELLHTLKVFWIMTDPNNYPQKSFLLFDRPSIIVWIK